MTKSRHLAQSDKQLLPAHSPVYKVFWKQASGSWDSRLSVLFGSQYTSYCAGLFRLPGLSILFHLACHMSKFIQKGGRYRHHSFTPSLLTMIVQSTEFLWFHPIFPCLFLNGFYVSYTHICVSSPVMHKESVFFQVQHLELECASVVEHLWFCPRLGFNPLLCPPALFTHTPHAQHAKKESL